MPAVVRKKSSDLDTHNDSPKEGSNNVFCNGFAVVRDGDLDTDNNSKIATSTKVFVNGKAIYRVGDKDSSSRRDTQLFGSDNVSAG